MTYSIVVSMSSDRPGFDPPPSFQGANIDAYPGDEFEVVEPGNSVAKDHSNTDPPREGIRERWCPNDREVLSG